VGGELLEIGGWMRWLTADEGGRAGPHPGGRYAATAFPESGTLADLRSIVFDDVPPGPGARPGQGAVNARWLVPADGPEPGTNLADPAADPPCHGWCNLHRQAMLSRL
jgi:hypothetical protein